jgi:hypothetical protein
VLTGAGNVAIELRAGHLRWTGEVDRTRFSSAEARAVAEILGLSTTTSTADAALEPRVLSARPPGTHPASANDLAATNDHGIGPSGQVM